MKKYGWEKVCKKYGWLKTGEKKYGCKLCRKYGWKIWVKSTGKNFVKGYK